MSTDTISRSSDTQSIARGRWRIDPTRSHVGFRTPTLWGLAAVDGHFDGYEGTLDLQRSPAIELTIDAASVDTNLGLRDGHLRSRDFFDVEDHPEVRFVSDTAMLEDMRLKVRGRLYAAGERLPLELEAALRPVGDEYEIDARTFADQRQLGMSKGALGMIPTPTELIVHARLVRDADRRAPGTPT